MTDGLICHLLEQERQPAQHMQYDFTFLLIVGCGIAILLWIIFSLQ